MLAISVGCVGVAWYLKKGALDYALDHIKHLEGSNFSCKIESLKGFSSAQVYKVVCGNGAYVVRTIEKYPQDHRQREIAFQKMVANAGVGPQVYMADIDKAFIVMEYIPDSYVGLLRRSCNFSEAMPMVAESLKKMHAIAQPNARKCPFLERMQKQVAQSQGALEKAGFAYATIRTMVERIEKEDATLFPQGLCHADLNPNNLLLENGKIILIDFDTVGYGDVFTDLGTIIAYGLEINSEYGKELFSEADQQSLVDTYFGRPLTLEEQTHLTLMVIAAALYYGSRALQKGTMQGGMQGHQEGMRFITLALELFKTVSC